MTDRLLLDTVDFHGVPVAVASVDSASEFIVTWAANTRGSLPVRFSNAYCMTIAERDPAYRELFSEGVTFPDGAPLAWLLRIGAGDAVKQVRGPTAFARALELSQGTDVRHFFLGSSQSSLDDLRRVIRDRFPQVHVAGMYGPPVGDLTPQALEDWTLRVVDARADIVWVALGTPKQDFAASALAARANLPVAAVGAAFDFLAGTVPTAPAWTQRAGLEWAFRLASEPRRLWRRYVFGNTRFLWMAARHQFGGNQGAQ